VCWQSFLPEPVTPAELDFLLVADRLRDPGNLGTLLRTAAAAGVQAAVVTPGTTDPFAPKVVRAGMGAHFYLPVFSLEWDKIDALALKHNLALYVADAEGGQPAWNVDLRRHPAWWWAVKPKGHHWKRTSMHTASLPSPCLGGRIASMQRWRLVYYYMNLFDRGMHEDPYHYLFL
jgi:hypothetical protein